MDAEPAFTDRRGAALAGLGVAVGLLATGAFWWAVAGGSSRYWHPGILGVLLTPVALLATLWYVVRVARAR